MGSGGGGGGGGHPVMEDMTPTSPWDATLSSVAFSMPATVNAGDLLVVIFTLSSTSASAQSVTPPAGWSPLFADDLSGLFRRRFYAYSKAAIGNEASTAQSFSFGVTCRGVAFCFRVRASTWSSAPEAVTSSITSTSVPAPTIAPSWGAADAMVIAVRAKNSNSPVPLAYPLPGHNATATHPSNSTILSVCSGEMTGANLSPGAFTFGAATAENVATIAIKGT